MTEREREIAEHLYLTEGTVKNHMSNILGKLGLNNAHCLPLIQYPYALDKRRALSPVRPLDIVMNYSTIEP